MTRCVRFAMLGALLLSGTSSMLARTSQAVSKGIKKTAARVTEKAQPAAKAPWFRNAFSSWKSYLAETPNTDYLPSENGEGLGIHFSHEWANDGFGADGHRVDPATLAFGKQNFGVRDMFAASNLLANEEVRVVKDVSQTTELPSNSRHFLSLLANQEIGFESSYSKQQITLSYDRLFLNNKLAVSVQVPLVRKAHTMEFDKKREITRGNRAALVEATSLNTPMFRSVMGSAGGIDAPGFYEQYNDLRSLISKTLGQNGLHMPKTQETFGIGDVAVSATYASKLNYVDDARFGAELVFGTGAVRRNVALWEPETAERSGATTIRMHAALAWHRGRFTNPFIKASLGYALPVGVARRMPYLLKHDGEASRGSRMIEVHPRTVPFSELLTLSGASFEQPENNIREVGSAVHKATVHQGLDLNLHIGNTCENCFNRPIVFSLAYDLKLHQGNRYSGLNRDAEFAMDVMTANTYGMTSTIMSSLGYRLNKDCFVNSSFEYRFAGRNKLATVKCQGGIAFRF